MYRFSFWIVCLLSFTGCASNRSNLSILSQIQPSDVESKKSDTQTKFSPQTSTVCRANNETLPTSLTPSNNSVKPAAFSQDSEQIEADLQIPMLAESVGGVGEWAESFEAEGEGLSLDAVIMSVYQSFPLLQGALYSRNVAIGDQIAASGEFDLKLKGASESGPVGFYQTYRQSIGLSQPLYNGGEAFAGYRIGRGSFQPWYLERQTNDGGEFKAGISLPILQNVDIDSRRAALWNAQYGRHLAEPEIQAQLIQFVLEASYAYWTWVAAGESYRIAQRVLSLADARTSRIESQVAAGLIDPPELTDNLRLVAERRGKLADAQRKLDQSAAKLSIYFRDAAGKPVIRTSKDLPGFPEPDHQRSELAIEDIQLALQQRPELKSLDIQRRQYSVEYAQAENLTLPALDGFIVGSKDVGAATSSKGDKTPFELEAGIYLDVPLQRRKARGKMAAIEGKLSQLSAKQQMVGDKIAVDVRAAWIAIEAAVKQVEQAREAVRLAEDLATRERENQIAGLSDLLKVTLREQYAAESAQKLVDAMLLYHQARADFRAAIGQDSL